MNCAYATRLTLPAARRQLAELQRREFALNHASGALEFDAVTLAPPENSVARAQTIGVLGETALLLVSSAEGVRLLDFLQEHIAELTPAERRSVTLLRRSGEMLRHVNLEEYLSFRKLANEASAAWASAHESRDFSRLEPWLARLFAAAKHIAHGAAPDTPEYDFWLDRNEEGLTEARCREFFDSLRSVISPLLRRAAALDEPDRSILDIRVSPLAQQRIAHANMDALGVDSYRCRLAVSDRPFTVAFSKYDVRMCTRYLPDSWTTSLYGVIHECGHALYELNTAEALQYTRLGAGASMGAHECQARFYENMVGRSLPWTEFMWPMLERNIPELARYSPRDLFRAVNAVRLTPLRSEADEVSYCLHIMLRFEVESAIMSGEIDVHDAPAMWNSLAREYLGCEVRHDSEGILQDSHWSAGQIGYFPSYALGTVTAAQLMARIRAGTDVDSALRRGDTTGINSWLREHIWRFGALYPPAELMDKALGGPVDVQCYADYLSDKLREVYEV